MADIEISKKNTNWGCGTETTLKINGTSDVSESILKMLFGENSTDFAPLSPVPERTTEAIASNMRQTLHTSITPEELKKAISEGRGPDVINPFDEIDIPTDDRGVVTVVCAFVNEKMARFVFKDCWDEYRMNDTATNETGYRDSKGRKHVLEDIYPHISEEWRDIITPRKLTETIDGEKVEYSDPLWLLSATDIFGDRNSKWWPDEEDSFQLPIFKRERDRVKEYDAEGTCLWWLRSVYASYDDCFCIVGDNGNAYYYDADDSNGFAPGFDI